MRQSNGSGGILAFKKVKAKDFWNEISKYDTYFEFKAHSEYFELFKRFNLDGLAIDWYEMTDDHLFETAADYSAITPFKAHHPREYEIAKHRPGLLIELFYRPKTFESTRIEKNRPSHQLYCYEITGFTYGYKKLRLIKTGVTQIENEKRIPHRPKFKHQVLVQIETKEPAKLLEQTLLQVGIKTELSGFYGYTEVRAVSDEELVGYFSIIKDNAHKVIYWYGND